MDSYSQWLRDPARAMAPAAVLAQPVTQLVGVSESAAQVLKHIGIQTILDLGASALFGLAQQISAAADGTGPLGAPGPLPADLLDDSARGASASQVARRGLEVLRALDVGIAGMVAAALPAPTVRDLGLWPPAQAARRLVRIAYGSEDEAEDREAPSELQPRMGRLPVERVSYQRLLFEGELDERSWTVLGSQQKRNRPSEPNPSRFLYEAPAPEAAEATSASLDEVQQPISRFGEFQGLGGSEGWGSLGFPLDLTDALLGEGFRRPGLGMRVTLAQTWTPVGLSLGQLLHSLALAPGEATRVAVVDWSRRVAVRTEEQIAEDEGLRNEMGRKRSLAEVTQAVAAESQQGQSGFTQTGSSWGIGAGAAGEYKGVSAAVNFGYSRTDAQGSAFSSSQGQRNLSGSLAQNIQDRTEQNASLARGRRASIVSEVSTEEAETLSTRVVANYNHMHALSVLYFEVVQLYRTRTEVIDVEPLLYLPVKPFDFSNAELVERYRGVLAEVALNAEARDSLLGIERKKAPSAEAPAGTGGIVTISLDGARGVNATLNGAALNDAAAFKRAMGPSAELGATEIRLHTREAAWVEIRVPAEFGSMREPLKKFLTLKVDGPAGLKSMPFFERTGLTALMPYAVRPYDQGVRLERTQRLDVELAPRVGTGSSYRIDLLFQRLDPAGIPGGDIVSVEYAVVVDVNDTTLTLGSVSFRPEAAPTRVETGPPPFDLPRHLNANALHYTMALLRRGDPALLGLVLGRIQWAGGSLLSAVDPVPVAHCGNYLVFRWTALLASPVWQVLLGDRGLAPEQRALGASEALVPMPSGGVFAEAVQGRFNSAEKLDLTRFWNWQDSPIPLQPPEIAALQAGLRQGGQNLTPSQLGAANLRQQEAPALPDPTGLAKALEGAVKGDAFRDMSGMNTLLTEGGKAMSLAAQGAREFMSKAMESVSAYGARVNHGKDMDRRAKAAEAQTGGTGTSGTSTPSGAGSVGGGTGGSSSAGGTPKPAGSGSTSSRTPPSQEERAFGGPAATTEPEPAAPRPEPRDQRVIVEVRETASAGSGGRGDLVAIDGVLELTGLPLDQSGLPLPGGGVFVPQDTQFGLAQIDIAAGSGSATLRLAADAPEDLAPQVHLRVRRLLGLDLSLGGDPIPGVPDDFEARLRENWAYANPVPVPAPGFAPRARAIRLRVTFEVVQRKRVEAALIKAGVTEEDAVARSAERTARVSLAGVVTGRELGADELKALYSRIVEGLDLAQLRRRIVSDATPPGWALDFSCVLGCRLLYRAASKTLEAEFPWALLQDVRGVSD